MVVARFVPKSWVNTETDSPLVLYQGLTIHKSFDIFLRKICILVWRKLLLSIILRQLVYIAMALMGRLYLLSKKTQLPSVRMAPGNGAGNVLFATGPWDHQYTPGTTTPSFLFDLIFYA